MVKTNDFDLTDLLTAMKHFVKIVHDNNCKYYEIVEDTYDYDNGLMLILYADKEHTVEIAHYVLDMDNKAELAEIRESLKDWNILED